MSYLRKRIGQPSTWLGLAAAAMAIVASNGVVDATVVSALLASLGLVQIDETK